MTLISDALAASSKVLESKGIETPRLDAEILLAHVLNTSRELLYIRMDEKLADQAILDFELLIQERATRKPIALILGIKEFWSLKFEVGEGTLIPRPDSETLVEAVLEFISKGKIEEGKILDLGTGSGCLLLSILSELPNWSGLGIDKSLKAVEIALRNSEKHNLQNRVSIKPGSWMDKSFKESIGKFDVIISNPPYILKSDINDLMAEVKDYDPLMALDGGQDGLDHYKIIIPLSFEKLNPFGVLFLEIGEGQEGDVMDIMSDAGFVEVKAFPDLSGKIRVISGHKA